MERNLEIIKENIRTINPDITDELLDLLYEYFSICHYDKLITQLKNPESQKTISEVITNTLITK